MGKLKLNLAACCGFFFVLHAFGQVDNQPPYSYFGVGNWYQPAVQGGFAMGGVSAAINDSTMLNLLNPASYGSLDITQFQAGVEMNLGSRVPANQSAIREWNMFLNHIQLGFPILNKKKFAWGMAAGFRPLTFMGYDFRDTTQAIFGTDTLLQARRFNGEGGWNRVSLGSGFRIFKGFFVGANSHFNFGSVSRLRSMRFDDENMMSTRIRESNRTESFSWDIGAQYRWRLRYNEYLARPDGENDTVKRSMQVVAGISFSPASEFSVFRDETGIQFYQNNNGEFGYDTLVLSGTKGKVTTPSRIAFGLAVGNPDQFTVAVDLSRTDYGAFKYFGSTPDIYGEEWAFAIGGQIRPWNFKQKFANGLNFRQNLIFRTGFRYISRGVRPDKLPVNEYGITFGVGIPVKHRYVYNINLTKARRTGSFVNIGVDLFTGQPAGNLGTSDYFIRLNLGFTIREWWFDRPMYN